MAKIVDLNIDCRSHLKDATFALLAIRCRGHRKTKKVNLAIFPELCVSGYFWEDESKCRRCMDQAVIENHTDWVERGSSLFSMTT